MWADEAADGGVCEAGGAVGGAAEGRRDGADEAARAGVRFFDAVQADLQSSEPVERGWDVEGGGQWEVHSVRRDHGDADGAAGAGAGVHAVSGDVRAFGAVSGDGMRSRGIGAAWWDGGGQTSEAGGGVSGTGWAAVYGGVSEGGRDGTESHGGKPGDSF